jgi:hypothetical protein
VGLTSTRPGAPGKKLPTARRRGRMLFISDGIAVSRGGAISGVGLGHLPLQQLGAVHHPQHLRASCEQEANDQHGDHDQEEQAQEGRVVPGRSRVGEVEGMPGGNPTQCLRKPAAAIPVGLAPSWMMCMVFIVAPRAADSLAAGRRPRQASSAGLRWIST